MTNNCAACTNNSRNTRNVSYFSLPRDAATRRQWLKIIGREDLIHRIGHVKTAPNHYKICEEHFESYCFIRNYRLEPHDEDKTKYKSVKYLNKDAVPTLKLRLTKGISTRLTDDKEVKVTPCSYFGCENTSETNAMFQFPARNTQTALLGVWLQHAGNKNLTGLSCGQLRHRYLCDTHFDESYIERGPGRPILDKNAVPFNMNMIDEPMTAWDEGAGSSMASGFTGGYSDNQNVDDETQWTGASEEPPVKQMRMETEIAQAGCAPISGGEVSYGATYNVDGAVIGTPQFRTSVCVAVLPLTDSSCARIEIKVEPISDINNRSTEYMQPEANEPSNIIYIKNEPAAQ